MKKIKILLSLFMVLSLIVGFVLPVNPIQGALSDTRISRKINSCAIKNNLSDIVKNWVIKNEAQYYKNITVIVTPVKIRTGNGKAEGIFNITVKETLKATSPEDLPAIRGMEKFKSLKKEELSPNQINAVNKEINSWVSELKNFYIGKVETVNIGLRITVNLSDNGSVIPSTARFLMEDAEGGFYKISELTPSADEMEAEGFNHAKEIADKAKDVTINNFVVDTYRRVDAASYADEYTSNPPDGEGNDQYDPRTNCWWDTTHWNNEEFKLSIHFYSDCADYVSQAMYKGGVPMDSIHDNNHWWYDNSEPLSSYNYCPWVRVPELRKYMINSGHWEPSSYQWANAGSIIVNQAHSHVMMVTKNDTIQHTLSAHMTDRKHFLYSSPNYPYGPASPYYANCEYYTVHNYVSYYSYRH